MEGLRARRHWKQAKESVVALRRWGDGAAAARRRALRRKLGFARSTLLDLGLFGGWAAHDDAASARRERAAQAEAASRWVAGHKPITLDSLHLGPENFLVPDARRGTRGVYLNEVRGARRARAVKDVAAFRPPRASLRRERLPSLSPGRSS